MTYPHPSSYYPELTDERLTVIAEALLDIRYNTYRQMDSPFDDTYTRETAVFGRSRNMLIVLALGGKYDWLSLINPGMDITFGIGSVPCRFFRDDPQAPEKPGFFKRNAVDCLFATDENDPVMWRFVVEKASSEEDEDHAFFIGYNVYQEKVSQWSYASSASVLHVAGDEIPAGKQLSAPEIDAREDGSDRNSKAQNE
ncbi:hypothetical protein [Pollutimonas sp. M17]|uniref:hypothetical protein n=1 Tax=Pollutimonas sp. M17 TaxID=2962065 RepID=UPI0021F4CF8D|nr:hypothetical protein [Pollutimonas sp. M17]UYO93931.1 hypothetical protein OEG81_00965 [Pollutimonas sp. M17]